MQQEANRSRSMGRRLVREPTLVEFPPNTHIVSISAGRSHAIALDENGNVWHWSNIWRPQRVYLPSDLENPTVVQVTANWGNSSVLTESGHLVVVPLPRMVPPSEPADLPDLLLDSETTVVFGLDLLHRDDTLQRAQPLASDDDKRLSRPVLEGDHIVQVAGMEHHTLALSRFGRIYRIDVSRATPSLATTSYVIEYLHFGAPATQQEDNQRSHLHRFISASFHSFAVYTLDGQVMLGKHDDPYDHQPKVISNHGFCKVSFGE
jgi:SCF-associated factor 1